MSDSQSTVGPPSEKTERNLRRARARTVYVFGYLVEWQWVTQGCMLPHRRWPLRYHVLPHWDGRTTEFWQQGPVWWGRVYWLTFGLSVLKSLPERRVDRGPYVLGGKFNRRKSHGTSEAYTRRASED